MMHLVSDNNRQKILQTIKNCQPVFEKLPGIVIVNDIQDGSVIYMSQKGLKELGVTLQELIEMGESYYQKFFNMEQSNEYVPEMISMIKRNDPEETYTFFQQVKFPDDNHWTWHLSSARILEHDTKGNPIAILTISQRIKPDRHYTHKVERILDELNFNRTNQKMYASLRKSEKNILKLLAHGHTSLQIAEMLHISINTVETHRKNIRKKLGVKSLVELSEYARAYDLV